MAHPHQHEQGTSTRDDNRRALAVVLALTASFTVVEVVGGLLTGSLALLADAGHMLSDNLSLGLALFAAWLAGRSATPVASRRDGKLVMYSLTDEGRDLLGAVVGGRPRTAEVGP